MSDNYETFVKLHVCISDRVARRGLRLTIEEIAAILYSLSPKCRQSMAAMNDIFEAAERLSNVVADNELVGEIGTKG